jgi:hypothetical protein
MHGEGGGNWTRAYGAGHVLVLCVGCAQGVHFDDAAYLQVCIKEPGQIDGQMFIIEDCEDCDIYVCDFTAQVQIDFCKNCRIFVGPSESSVSATHVLLCASISRRPRCTSRPRFARGDPGGGSAVERER